MYIKILLVVILASSSDIILADESVDITDPGQVAELHKLQRNLDTVSASISECMDAGHEHKECLCQYRDLIIHFNSGVNDLFANHPSLEAYDLVRFRAPDGIWISQSLKNIRMQASTEPACD